MTATQLPEHWLRGPVENISPFFQPVAHALLQARDEVEKEIQNFPDALLWEKPAGVASLGFHLQHLNGVLERLFTYAAGKPLSAEQLSYLKKEGEADAGITTTSLLSAFQKQVDNALEALKNFSEDDLTKSRGVGRMGLPSTVLGLLFHAAEHTMRHTGQLLVTAKILQAQQHSVHRYL